MFVKESRYHELATKYHSLVLRWNALVDLINARGGLDFLSGQSSPQFTKDEINTLLRLCHPDKHGNSKTATAMTQKLLSLRRG